MLPRLVSSLSGLLAVAVVAALSGCGGAGEGPKCQPGFSFCGGTCVSEADDANCGACGNACSGTNSCQPSGESFSCQPTCTALLNTPWNNGETGAWDGADRTAVKVAFEFARNQCAGLGGRLPTATELARLSRDTAAPGRLGTLWSLTADGPTRRFTVDIATGTAAPIPTTSTAAFRCLCPAPAPAAFSGNACFGPPGAAQCVTPGNGPQAWDAADRLALSKAGAIWECDRVGGHLPTAAQVAEAISLTPKLAGGTNQLLHTGDDQSYDRDALVRFGTAYDVTQDLSNVLRPFRCLGLTSAGALPAGPLSASVHLADRGGMQADLHDATTPLTYGAAVSACWNAGGHLPTATELAALVASGLPNGSGAPVLAADTLFPDGAGWHTSTYRWSGGPTVPGYDAGPTTWVWHIAKGDANAYPYRCLYYPIDPTYARPAEADCQGGCTEFLKVMAGSSQIARNSIDLEDRSAATFTAAAATCAGLGAHIPSMRDYTELIRAGLAGTSISLWTADIGYNGAAGGPYAVTWTGGSNGAFTGGSVGGLVGLATPTKFRCLWTNERR